ncbi:MAG: hypothetical protein JEZ02_03145 [Desulfatibacillum sp.]|nr:hypothetical protein [Desulfatibacillum sp.]
MCMDHEHHGPAHGGAPSDLPLEMEEKWPAVLREIGHLVAHIKDVRLSANPEPLPHQLEHVQKNPVVLNLLKAALMEDRPGLKRPVAQRMASKIGDFFLWNRATSMPVIHELGTLSAWWTDQMPLEVIHQIRDIALDFILNGRVMPIQAVWTDLLDAELVFMGHCVCRSSGIANDFKNSKGKVYTLTSEKENIRLLNRLISRYESLINDHGSVPDTHSNYLTFLNQLKKWKKDGDARYSVQTLLEQTYPAWEFLPVLDKFTQSWIRGLHKNRKAHQLHKSLAFELANIFYLTRGNMFTSMKVVDTPYTICSCPSPDHGGGCALSNWYYHGLSNTSLIPCKEPSARRKDRNGKVLPCNQFPGRAHRDCLGCGCKHVSRSPRSVGTVLRQADLVLKDYGLYPLSK